jgi:SAM-dependent methyltransferase
LCAHYTGVDFSETGLNLAREKLSSLGVPFDLATADVSALPFPDCVFDAAYSAHVLYHIDDIETQAKAYKEICRVVRPGGRVVLVLANPRPLLFPVRMLTRLVAETPVLSDVIRKARPSPLPYRPMTVGWMRRQLASFGDVRMSCYALESTWLSRHISETNVFGKAFMGAVTEAERVAPKLLVRLGNYVLITVVRK